MVSAGNVLEIWRQHIIFSETVLLEDGRTGAIGGSSPDGSKLVVVFGRKNNIGEFSKEELFPIWWPDLLEAEKGSHLGGKYGNWNDPDWYNPSHGRKPKIPHETLEQKEHREQLQRVASKDVFQDETAAEEGEMPVLFYQPYPLDPALISTYVHVPDSPEITMSDIYDVIHCRGQWSRLKGEGYPCRRSGDHGRSSAEDIARATQFLLSKGFKPMA